MKGLMCAVLKTIPSIGAIPSYCVVVLVCCIRCQPHSGPTVVCVKWTTSKIDPSKIDLGLGHPPPHYLETWNNMITVYLPITLLTLFCSLFSMLPSVVSGTQRWVTHQNKRRCGRYRSRMGGTPRPWQRLWTKYAPHPPSQSNIHWAPCGRLTRS